MSTVKVEPEDRLEESSSYRLTFPNMPARLKRAEQRAAAARMKEGDEDARNAVVCDLIPMAVGIAGRHSHREGRTDDALQAALAELVKVLPTHWDPDKSAVTTYSHWRIRGAIAGHVHAQVMAARGLSQPGHGDLMDLVPARDTRTIEPPSRELLAALAEAVDGLPEREAHVIRRRFGLDGRPPEQFTQIGERLGVSKERVRQIQEVALRQLRVVFRKRFAGRFDNEIEP
jgi:RNA polymerase sigma factor (sigma-70 family)